VERIVEAVDVEAGTGRAARRETQASGRELGLLVGCQINWRQRRSGVKRVSHSTVLAMEWSAAPRETKSLTEMEFISEILLCELLKLRIHPLRLLLSSLTTFEVIDRCLRIRT